MPFPYACDSRGALAAKLAPEDRARGRAAGDLDEAELAERGGDALEGAGGALARGRVERVGFDQDRTLGPRELHGGLDQGPHQPLPAPARGQVEAGDGEGRPVVHGPRHPRALDHRVGGAGRRRTSRPDPGRRRRGRRAAAPLDQRPEQRLAAARPCRSHSGRVSMNHVHQQPATAPRSGPNRRSRSPQRSGVSGLHSIIPGTASRSGRGRRTARSPRPRAGPGRRAASSTGRSCRLRGRRSCRRPRRRGRPARSPAAAAGPTIGRERSAGSWLLTSTSGPGASVLRAVGPGDRAAQLGRIGGAGLDPDPRLAALGHPLADGGQLGADAAARGRHEGARRNPRLFMPRRPGPAAGAAAPPRAARWRWRSTGGHGPRCRGRRCSRRRCRPWPRPGPAARRPGCR